MTKSSQIVVTCILLFLSVVPRARAIELQFPVACQLMTDCWITNHVDLNKAKGIAEDYMCGQQATDNNLSTHISMRSNVIGDQTIAVIAAAAGTVTVARDIGGFCGVRVLIDHGKGWETSYCHLKPDTLRVHEGQQVQSGDIVGGIGMSGKSDWPHLSFALMRNGLIFDPFSGRTIMEGCLPQSKSLWQGGMNPFYEPAHVTDIGFTIGDVKKENVLSGHQPSATTILTSTPQLSLWGMMMNVKKGDTIHLQITDSSGRLLKESRFVAEQPYDFFPIYLSLLRRNTLWSEGRYKGAITITRFVNDREITVGKTAYLTMVHTQKPLETIRSTK